MRIISCLLSLFVILLGQQSCVNDILDKKPLDLISDDIMWDDEKLIDSYIARQYIKMDVFRFDSRSTIGNYWEDQSRHMVITNISDEVGPPVWSMSNPAKYKSGGLTISGGLLEWWETAYEINREINLFIENLSSSSLPDEFISSRTAEARFLRAFNYFSLVKRYGGVPIITNATPIDAEEGELYPKRDSEKEVYDFIIDEIEEIEEDLSSLNIYGRASQGAALALKSRAALYAGSIAKYGEIYLDGLLGIPKNLFSDYYEKSHDASKKLMDLNKYDLYNNDDDKINNFKNIFLDEDNEEMIFVKPFDEEINPWMFGFLNCPKPHGYDAGMQGSPYLEMAEAFEYVDGRSGELDRNVIQEGLWSMEDLWGGKDPRFFASIYTNETPWKDGRIDWHWGIIGDNDVLYDEEKDSYNGIPAFGNQRNGNNFGSGFGILKMLDEDAETNFTEKDGVDCPIFRYAEILLNHAEASFELEKFDEALNAINQIRERAGVSILEAINTVDVIRQERKVELAFEGHRYWDVRRWRTAVDELSQPGSRLRYVLDYETGKYKLIVYSDYDGASTPPRFYEYNYYLPITKNRTEQNPNLIENPGY